MAVVFYCQAPGQRARGLAGGWGPGAGGEAGPALIEGWGGKVAGGRLGVASLR
jgi:hypothetical protein